MLSQKEIVVLLICTLCEFGFGQHEQFNGNDAFNKLVHEVDALRTTAFHQDEYSREQRGQLKEQAEQLKQQGEQLKQQGERILNFEHRFTSTQCICDNKQVLPNVDQKETQFNTDTQFNSSDEDDALSGNDGQDAELSKVSIPKRGITTGESIAFSVYLDHDLSNLPVLAVIKFNRVITNAGSGYNVHLGVFIAPISGTYFFTYTTASHSDKRTPFQLGVDDSNMAGTVTDAYGDTLEDMSYNTVIVHVDRGQSEWIQTTFEDGGLDNFRFATFSGLLLF